MKRLMLALVVGFVMLAVGKVEAGKMYSAEISTFTVDSDTTTFATLYPSITGTIQINSIVFKTTETASGILDTAILISVYENATSTTAANVGGEANYWVCPIISTNTTQGNIGRSEYKYIWQNRLTLTDPGFFLKKTPAATDNVYIEVMYEKR